MCWRAIHGRSSPCPGCPARGAGGVVRLGVLRVGPGEPRVFLCAAQRVDRGTVRVNAFRLDARIIDEMLHARLNELCEHAHFTPRQREVLDLMLLGRSVRDISVALRISISTVKFHVANVLNKLGAESRVDLLRLLV